MAEVRRSSAYVVLDLPHVWEPWVRQTLREADEVVIVAAPDLASLRNTDNMLKLLRSERDKASAPLIVLSMAGIPKRPEIPLKDFAEAIHVKPVMTFAFEPELFGRASAQGQMIYEAMPDSKAALQVDTLASLLTGREPFAAPAPRVRAKAPELKQKHEPEVSAPVAPSPVEETNTAPELPVLDLTVAIPNEPGPKPAKRRAARTGFLALQEPIALKQRRGSRGLVRMAAAVLVLVLAGVYFVQQRAIADGAPQPATGAFRA
jgi:hypothetical protein